MVHWQYKLEWLEGGVTSDNRGFKGAWCNTYPGPLDPLTIEARSGICVASGNQELGLFKEKRFVQEVFEVDCTS